MFVAWCCTLRLPDELGYRCPTRVKMKRDNCSVISYNYSLKVWYLLRCFNYQIPRQMGGNRANLAFLSCRFLVASIQVFFFVSISDCEFFFIHEFVLFLVIFYGRYFFKWDHDVSLSFNCYEFCGFQLFYYIVFVSERVVTDCCVDHCLFSRKCVLCR